MGRRKSILLFIVGALTGVLSAVPAGASRCGDQNPPRCGLDSQTEPPDPMLGGTGGCTEASLAASPLFDHTGACRPGDTKVIYDLGVPFPDNGLAADQSVAGRTSFVTIRAGANTPCAHMVDTVDPKPCPDPQLCPDPMSPQPEGAIKVAVTGYAIGCWSPPTSRGCRDLRLHTQSVCLHIGDERLGPGCLPANGVDCSNVSTEQIALAVPGGSNHQLCPPSDPTTSCRGERPQGEQKIRFRIGGFCSTNNCANPGTAPEVDPDKTCVTSWGASTFGYNRPVGVGINQPGWYDWKTGSLKVDLSTGRPSCGDIQACIGERTGVRWDLSLVAVPRAGQALPCAGDACDAASCAP
jgi:hypothetical protein